jgi:16S rRNA (cytosine967-C5)-methyltransferase
VRGLAHRLLLRLWQDEAYLDRLLSTQLERVPLDTRDAGLLTELCYGTVRHKLLLETVLNARTSGRFARLPLAVQQAMLLGAYQLLFMRIPPHAAVSESVALLGGRFRGLRGVVNGTLRRLADVSPPNAKAAEAEETPTTKEATAEDPSSAAEDDGAWLARLHPSLGERSSDRIEAASIRYSIPEWLVREVSQQVGDDEAVAWARANATPVPVSLRLRPGINKDASATTVEQYAQVLQSRGAVAQADDCIPNFVQVRHTGSVEELPGFAEGQVTIQDPATWLVAQCAGEVDGEVVVDLCAAPGGKTALMAEAVGPEGKVLATDLHQGRCALLQRNMERLRLHNVIVSPCDGANPETLKNICRQHLGADARPSVILVDAPCSGLGTLRQHPELKYRTAESKPTDDGLLNLQDRLLDSAAQVVAPGGAIVYSVCTVTRAEGIERAKAFLRRHAGEFRAELPQSSADAVAPFVEVHDGIPTVRTWTHRNAYDGFFAARFVRREES